MTEMFGNTTLNPGADKHAKIIRMPVYGNAGHTVNWREMKIDFDGTLENKSNDFVLTKVVLLLKHADLKDRDGKPGA